MKYLQDNDGNTIAVPDEVYLFKRTISFIDWAIRGDFSTTFSVPNDSETRKALGYYSLNQVNRPTSKVFRFYFDGTSVADGRVFIQGVGTTFDLFFMSGNSNWLNQITGSIRDIDLSEFDVDFTAPNVISRMSATEGIIFPLIDWCYNYRKLSNHFLVKPITGVSVDTFYDFYPCFYQHTILERLFDSYGIRLKGNLIDNVQYKDIVVTPEVVRSAAYISPLNGLESMISKQYIDQTLDNSAIGGYTPIEFVSGSRWFSSSSNGLVATFDTTDLTLTYTVTARLSAIFMGGTNALHIHVLKNGSYIDEYEIEDVPISSQTYNHTFTIATLNSGDVITFEAQGSGPQREYDLLISMQLSFEFTSNAAIVSEIIPEVSQFDFIRHIAQRFNCLVDYDELTQEITFTMLDSIRKENAVDLTDALVDFRHDPSDYGKRNYIRSEEAEELFPYKSEDLNYGDHVVESDGEEDQDVIKTLFAPAETFTAPQLEWLITNVPLIRLEDADEGVPYVSVQDPTGISGKAEFTNATLFSDYTVGSIVRIASDSGEYSGFAVIEEADTSGLIALGVRFGSTDTGRIFTQKIVFPKIGARELLVVRNTAINNINTGSQIYGDINLKIVDENGTYPVAEAAWAFYAKPNINTDLDRYRIGLNYGPVLNTANIPFGDVFQKTLRKIIQAPKTSARFLLSQTQYQNLSLSEYVYLRTKDFEGYFLMSDLAGFKNQFTPVEAALILID